MADRSRSANRAPFGSGVAKSSSGPPVNEIVPPSGVSSPFSERSTVVLPEPLGPMSTTTSPRRTSRSIERSTSLSPKDLRRPRAVSSGESSGAACGASGLPAASAGPFDPCRHWAT